jgi:hypothetical protein
VLFRRIFSSSIINKTFTGFDNTSNTVVVSEEIGNRDCVSFGNTWFIPFLVGNMLIIFLEFYVLYVCLRSVSCDQCCPCLWIVFVLCLVINVGRVSGLSSFCVL